MFSMMTKTAPLILSLLLFNSSPPRCQTREDTAKIKQDSVLTKTDSSLTPVDTLLGKADTSHGTQNIAAKKDTLDIIVTSESLDTTPGFRVQLGSTQNLSEAMMERTKAETLLVDYNVYIIYDSPNYKVRAGDFRARYDASQAANFISGHGFPSAWVVPDNVFKNPQRKNGNE